MICKYCNHQNHENNKFCINCGKELTNNRCFSNNQEYDQYNNLGNYSFDNDVNNKIYNNQYQNSYQTDNTIQNEEKANIGLAILSFFIPLAGLIIFLVKQNKEPKTAKVSGICALTSFILYIIIVIVSFLLFTSMFNKPGNNVTNDSWLDELNTNNDILNGNDMILDEFSGSENFDTTSDWRKYEIFVNNNKITLPTTYNDIKTATNASIKSADEKSYLSSNHYTLANMYKNDKLALHIEFTNNSKTDLLYVDCQVTRVSQTKYQVSNGATIVTFPGGLTAGMEITEAKIIELFGTPYDTDKYSSDGYESNTYTYVENTTWTTTNNYKIRVVNGIIEELQLDNRN